MISSKQLNNLLNSAQTMSQKKKEAFAASLRFAFEDRENLMECDEYEKYVKQIGIVFLYFSRIRKRLIR